MPATDPGHTQTGWYCHDIFGDPPPANEKYQYHFSKFDTLTQMAEGGELWLTSPRTANDPRERFGRTPTFQQDMGSLGDPRPGDSWKRDATADYNRLKARFRFSCFSRDHPDAASQIDLSGRFDLRAFASAPMWNHYADGHTGVCVVFDQVAVAEAMATSFPGVGEVVRVEYIDGFDIKYFRGNEIKADYHGKIVSDTSDGLRSLLHAKNRHWSYENEIRLIAEVEDDGPAKLPLDGLIEGVAVGSNFDSTNLAALADACEQLGVDLRNTASMALSDTGVLVPNPLLLPSGLHVLTDLELRNNVRRRFVDDDPLFFDF